MMKKIKKQSSFEGEPRLKDPDGEWYRIPNENHRDMERDFRIVSDFPY